MRRTCWLLLLALTSCKTDPATTVKEDEAAPLQAASSIGADGFMTVDAMVARAQGRSYWPDQTHDWQTSPAAMDSAACKDFKKFVLPDPVDDGSLPEEKQTLKTDGVMVVRGGVVLFETARGAYAGNGPTRLHPMWSASKSFSAAIFGALAQASAMPGADPASALGARLAAKLGHPLTTETRMGELLSPASLAALNTSPAFANLTVGHLLTMAPNLHWAERYAGSLTESTIVRMLWVAGKKSGAAKSWGGAYDMSAYAAKPLLDKPDTAQFGAEGVGKRFNYSSGNAVLLMRGLKDVYSDAEYDAMPWTTLFDRIGMRRVGFERDPAGTYVGSSYVHTTLHDMAKFGYALLNGGYYNGTQVIEKSWVDRFRRVAPVELEPGTTEEAIFEEQGFYGMGFYVNPDPKTLARTFTPGFYDTLAKAPYQGTRFFPNIPTDMFMAAGHYGQNIIIFPQDDLMLVRFSHDKEYWTKIDAMASKMRACFL